jgi:hypothetical protein
MKSGRAHLTRSLLALDRTVTSAGGSRGGEARFSDGALQLWLRARSTRRTFGKLEWMRSRMPSTRALLSMGCERRKAALDVRSDAHVPRRGIGRERQERRPWSTAQETEAARATSSCPRARRLQPAHPDPGARCMVETSPPRFRHAPRLGGNEPASFPPPTLADCPPVKQSRAPGLHNTAPRAEASSPIVAGEKTSVDSSPPRLDHASIW